MPPVSPINQTLMWPIVHRKSRIFFVEIYIFKMTCEKIIFLVKLKKIIYLHEIVIVNPPSLKRGVST